MIKVTGRIDRRKVLNPEFEAHTQKSLGRAIFPITTHMRAINAEKYIIPSERLLDVGCGDGYFIKRSKCTERFGLDKFMGDDIVDSLPFDDNYFDYVTMLAVLDQLEHPDAVVRDVHRVLKPGGRFVFTTNHKSAERLIRLYVRDLDSIMNTFIDHDRVLELAGDRFAIAGHHRFFLGLDQAYCLQKK